VNCSAEPGWVIELGEQSRKRLQTREREQESDAEDEQQNLPASPEVRAVLAV
jgi:hypothetical protein